MECHRESQGPGEGSARILEWSLRRSSPAPEGNLVLSPKSHADAPLRGDRLRRACAALLSCLANDETALVQLIAVVGEAADGEGVVWATDLNSGGAALLIAVLAVPRPITVSFTRQADLPRQPTCRSTHSPSSMQSRLS